jgi:hypothetical protein
MRLYHATLARNWTSIRTQGLLCGLSQGKMRVVWLHTEDRSAWAMLHTVRRHGGRVEDVVVISVEVGENALRRHQSGLYYHVADVLPAEIVAVRGFDELSKSPVEEG